MSLQKKICWSSVFDCAQSHSVGNAVDVSLRSVYPLIHGFMENNLPSLPASHREIFPILGGFDERSNNLSEINFLRFIYNKENIFIRFVIRENLLEFIQREVRILLRILFHVTKKDEDFFKLTDDDIPKLGEHILRRDMKFHEDHPEFWKIFAWENLLKGKHKEHIRGLKQPVNAHSRQMAQSWLLDRKRHFTFDSRL